MEDQGQSTTGGMEEVMMLIRLLGGKALYVSSYWDEKECGGFTAPVLFYAEEEFSPPRRHSSCRWGVAHLRERGGGPEGQRREHIGLASQQLTKKHDFNGPKKVKE